MKNSKLIENCLEGSDFVMFAKNVLNKIGGGNIDFII